MRYTPSRMARQQGIGLTAHAGCWRRASLLVALSVLAGGASFAETIPNDTVSTLVDVHAGLCLGVKGGSSANGVVLQSQTCSGAASQRWKVRKDSAGYAELVNIGSGLCAQVTGASSTASATVSQGSCDGGANQKWNLSDQGQGQFAIIAQSSGLAMDVMRASTVSGAGVIQWPWHAGANQKWTLPDRSQSGASDGPQGFGAGTTGGKGGAVVTVTTPDDLKTALCGSYDSLGYCSDKTPRIIRVSGIIDFRETEKTATRQGCTYSNNYCSVNGKSEKILNVGSYCSGKPLYDITFDAAGITPLMVGSNKTLIGVGANSGIKGKGLILKGGMSNVIIRNLSITDINEGVIWGGDAITLDNASNVWIDHNHIARIGRQMLVTGWGTAQKVTVSNNDFDGTTEYGHYCNGKHYWVMLLVAENQTITLMDNRIYNTAGRSPELGKPASAASGGTVHIVNNLYEQNYFMGIRTHDNVVSLVEGNVFEKGENFFPILQTGSNTNKVFAPVDGNIATADTGCKAVLGRGCVPNEDANGSSGFVLNSDVMPAIAASSATTAAIKSVKPAATAMLPSLSVGPQGNIGN